MNLITRLNSMITTAMAAAKPSEVELAQRAAARARALSGHTPGNRVRHADGTIYVVGRNGAWRRVRSPQGKAHARELGRRQG